jgi:hypothetical protein
MMLLSPGQFSIFSAFNIVPPAFARSLIRTFNPLRMQYIPAVKPAGPAPKTKTS